jgi:hypothetical protein
MLFRLTNLSLENLFFWADLFAVQYQLGVPDFQHLMVEMSIDAKA